MPRRAPPLFNDHTSKMQMSSEFAKKWISVSLVFAVAFLSYLRSLQGGFVFDDHRAILTNDDLDSGKTNLLDVFQHDFWGGSMSRKESHKSYRPLTVLTYRYLNYYFYQLEPHSYHLVNLFMHCIASVLFLKLCEKFVLTTSKPASLSLCDFLKTDIWPTFGALLFAVHSIHTEAVASVVGRAEVLSCIFFLLALLTYISSVSHIRGTAHKTLPQTKWHYFSMCLIFSACSLLSKEQGVTVLGVCAGYDVFLNWEAWSELVGMCVKRRKRKISGEGEIKVEVPTLSTQGESEGSAVKTLSTGENGKIINKASQSSHTAGIGKHKIRGERSSPVTSSDSNNEAATVVSRLFGRLGIIAVTGAVLLWLRLSMNYGSEPIFKPQELKAAYHTNRSVRALSLSNIYSINLWLLLSPSSLCCDWSLGSVPLVTTLTDSRNVLSLVLYTGLVMLIIHILRSRRDRVPVGMGLMLLLIPFLPSSGLVFRVGFVVAERVLYMPSLGSCLLVAVGAQRLTSTTYKMQKALVHIFIVALLVTMAVKTHQRNKDWETDFKLFESGVTVIPSNVKLRNNYGMELKAIGRVEEAGLHYKAAIKIDPDYGEVYFNYGNLLSDEGDFTAAAKNFERAITYPQMYGRTLNNLATTYFRLGRLKEAEEKFLESLQLNPDQATTYNNLASLYGDSKRYRESEKMFKKALKLNPTYIEAQFNLGTLYIQMGLWDDGEKQLRRALELNPDHYGAINNLKVAQHYKQKAKREHR